MSPHEQLQEGEASYSCFSWSRTAPRMQVFPEKCLHEKGRVQWPRLPTPTTELDIFPADSTALDLPVLTCLGASLNLASLLEVMAFSRGFGAGAQG